VSAPGFITRDNARAVMSRIVASCEAL
jgi:hypothetical protein